MRVSVVRAGWECVVFTGNWLACNLWDCRLDSRELDSMYVSQNYLHSSSMSNVRRHRSRMVFPPAGSSANFLWHTSATHQSIQAECTGETTYLVLLTHSLGNRIPITCRPALWLHHNDDTYSIDEATAPRRVWSYPSRVQYNAGKSQWDLEETIQYREALRLR